MAYLGNTPSETFHQATSQVFNGDGSTTAFTLEKRVNRAEEIEVFVNNIQQQPTVAYSANNTTLTFTEAPDSATGNIYVVYRMFAQQNTFNALHDFTDAVTMASTLTVTGNSTMAGTLGVTGNTTVTGSVITSTGFSVGNTAILGQEIDVSSGDFTLDVAGDIILDADSGAWRFKDDGTSIIELSKGSGSSPTFYSPVSDSDIVFRGNDGGSVITALTLDMSSSGQANFNSNIFTGNTAEFVDGTGTGDKGVQINPIGMVVATRNGGISGIFGRQASSGDIVQFRHEGVAVGSIQERFNNIQIGTGETSLIFNNASNEIAPSGSSGGTRDNTTDLGANNRRWKNVWVGSNIYLGGTGSANAFDDYEEGTFTPGQGNGVTVSGSFSSSGKYTKIGRMVFIRGSISGSSSISFSKSTGSQLISGLPFAQPNADNGHSGTGQADNLTNLFGLRQSVTFLYPTANISGSSSISFTVMYFVS